MKRLALGFLLLAAFGCGSSEKVEETTPEQAKANLPQEQQDAMHQKMAAWDPKKDKKK